ncbi:MAG TPA: hypothetical protein VL988_09420 [Solirubrobacteraceae bacterium]|nr:hypothetical protein [Solirubrobacteraceae bacterium]
MADDRGLEIAAVERFDRETLLGALRRTPLRGHGQARIYERAELELTAPLPTGSFVPAQRYVLAPGVRTMLALRQGLLAQGADLFDLQGGAYVRLAADPDEVIPVTPPIVEESHEPDGRKVLLIADGLHRVYAAHAEGLPISVVLVRELPAELPYYAYALPGGWAEVSSIEELPDSYEKKHYRQPSGYKALFREYNAVIPGIQKDRKKSNPPHLQA